MTLAPSTETKVVTDDVYGYRFNPSPPPIEESGSKEYPIKEQIVVKSEVKEKETSDGDVTKEKKKKEQCHGQQYFHFEPFGATSDLYYCSACKAPMNSEHTWYKHISGKRHKKRVAAMNYKAPVKVLLQKKENSRFVKVNGAPRYVRTRVVNQVPKIQARIEQYMDAPIIGMSFITEICSSNPHVEPSYMCCICPAECQMLSLINHLIGFKHRMSYMKLFMPETYKRMSVSTASKNNQSMQVLNHANDLEKADGRGTMLVEMIIDENTTKFEKLPASMRTVPEFPRSAKDILSEQVKRDSHERNLAFIRSACKTFVANENSVVESHMQDLLQLKKFFLDRYYEEKMAALTEDKKMQITKYIIERKHDEVMELIFEMKLQPYGSTSINIIEKLLPPQTNTASAIK